jgi:hypothetical protein
MATLTPPFEVSLELAGVGAGWTDVSADVVRQRGIVIKHGIPSNSVSDRCDHGGTGTFTLRNDEGNSGAKLGYYSLHHANKRSGWGLNIGCRIRIQDPATSTWQVRFIGKIDAINVIPCKTGSRMVAVTAVNWIDEASRWALVPEIGEQLDLRGDQILANILARMPVQPTATSFDVGHENYPYALDQSASAKQPALTEFAKLAASEFGYVYVTAGGTLRYEGRHARLLKTSSWTITDATLSDGESGLDGSSHRDDILNTIRVTTHAKVLDPLPPLPPTTVVYSQANVIPIAAGATQVILGQYRDQVTGDTFGATEVQPVVANVDYRFNSQDSDGGTDLTGSLTVTVANGPSGVRLTFENTSGTAGFLTFFQLTGRALRDIGIFESEARDVTSVTNFGERVFSFDMHYQADANVGQAAADFIQAGQSSELARVNSAHVYGTTAATLTQLLTREISDRVTVIETVTGVSADFYINAIELAILRTEHVRGVYTLAPVVDAFGGASLFVINSSSINGADVLATF